MAGGAGPPSDDRAELKGEAMSEPTLQSPLATMRATVQSIEAKLRHGDLPEEGLGDLKHAIDDVRLRLWAVITAQSSSEPEGVLLRFRLRRATEICRNVVADLDAGTLGAHQREMLELRDVAKAMTDRLSAAIRGAV
jgi:hypothetical protein